jgi:hypothetical protein
MPVFIDCHIYAVEDGLDKQFEEVAKGRDEDLCRKAASASKANMQLPFVHCTPAAASRILYCNPVCFLSTMLPSPCPAFNVMALSWLAPANSHGGLVFCIKKSRASFAAIAPGAVLGLRCHRPLLCALTLIAALIRAAASPPARSNRCCCKSVVRQRDRVISCSACQMSRGAVSRMQRQLQQLQQLQQLLLRQAAIALATRLLRLLLIQMMLRTATSSSSSSCQMRSPIPSFSSPPPARTSWRKCCT